MADRVDFWTDDGHSPINCEEFICALVRAKYRDGQDLSAEENERIRIDRAEVLRQFVAAAVSTGRLVPRGRDFLPIDGIPVRETYDPFHNLFFERGPFLQFAKETWLVSPSDNESSPQPSRITVEDIAHMIAVQRAERSITVGRNPDEREGVRRSIELAMHLVGWSPDGIPGVIPQIVEMACNQGIRLHGPIEAHMPDLAAVRAAPGLWSLTAEDAQRVLASLYPGVRRYTVSDVADIIARRTYPNDMTNARDLETALAERMQSAIERDELAVNERRKDGEILLSEHSVDEWLIREQIPVLLNPTTQANMEQAAMAAAGRLTIDSLVGVLAHETGKDAARWESTLVSEIKKGALPLKNPRDHKDFLPYPVPKNLRTFYDCVDLADVDKLLDENPGWQVSFRFLAKGAIEPITSSTEGAIRTVSRRGDEWADAELRALLEEMALPGATQQKLAEKYGVTRQRISVLIKQAKEKFQAPVKASWLPIQGAGTRKVRGSKY